MKHILFALAALLPVATLAAAADTPGTTRIAGWKDDKACAFILMFDDSIPSHVKNVVPELAKRGFTGTFYINPGAGLYAVNRRAWEKAIPGAGFELANHTMTHKGGATPDDIAKEIRACNDAIHASTPALPWPRLVQRLTLVTTLPAGWTACSIEQGQRHAEAKVSAGAVRYDALPGKEPIVITKTIRTAMETDAAIIP